MLHFPLSRKWRCLCALGAALVLAAAAFAGLAWRDRAGRSAVEVVYARPLRAEHAPAMAGVPAKAGVPDTTGAAQGLQQPLAGEARVELPVDYYDFGRVGSKEVARRDFLLINRGSADLVIYQAYTTCGCTTAELSASVIPPGKASRVTVIFDAGYHPISGQSRAAIVRRGLVLETSDPNHPQVEIWVQASIGK